MAEGGGGCGRATRDVRKIERIQITGRGAEEGGRLARLMVEGVSDEVGSLGEESNAKEGGMEGKRVPREREWNQYVEAHTSVCLRSHMRVSVWPGEAKHASFHARGVDKGGRLLSPLPSSLPLRVQPSRPHTRVRPYSYAEFDGIECYWNFFSCLPPRNKQFAQISREIIVAGLLREGNELGNCRGSYCSLFVNFIHDFYTFSYFSLVSFVECVEDDILIFLCIQI